MKTPAMKIGYVCTNFNNSDYTLKAVDTLLLNTQHTYQVVVVDNNSSQSEAALLRPLTERLGNVSVILNATNVGYFRGLNIGIKQLRSKHPDIEWMVVGNNDLEFPVDFADRLANIAHELEAYPVV